MKICRPLALVRFVPTLVILLAGCATRRFMVGAWHNPPFTLARVEFMSGQTNETVTTEQKALQVAPDEMNQLIIG